MLPKSLCYLEEIEDYWWKKDLIGLPAEPADRRCTRDDSGVRRELRKLFVLA